MRIEQSTLHHVMQRAVLYAWRLRHMRDDNLPWTLYMRS